MTARVGRVDAERRDRGVLMIGHIEKRWIVFIVLAFVIGGCLQFDPQVGPPENDSAEGSDSDGDGDTYTDSGMDTDTDADTDTDRDRNSNVDTNTDTDTGETDNVTHLKVDADVLYGIQSPYFLTVDRLSGAVTPTVKIRLQEGDNYITRLDYDYQTEQFYTLVNTTSGYEIAAVDTCSGEFIHRHPIMLDSRQIPKAEGLSISDDGEFVYIGADIDPDVGDSEALLFVDLATGEATIVVSQVNTVTHDVDGIAMLPDGTLYVSDYNGDASETLFLNVETGETVRLSGTNSYADMDYHPTWEILYGVNDVNHTLGTVNQSTGGLTIIATYPDMPGLFPGAIVGIASGHRVCEDQVLYGLLDETVITISPLDGKSKEVSKIVPRTEAGVSTSDVFSKLTYDSHRKRFHVLRSAPDHTFHFDTLNPCTGAIIDGPEITGVGDPIQAVGSIAYAENTDTFYITFTQTPETSREERLGILNPTSGIIASIGVLSDGEIRDGDHLVFAHGTLYLGDVHLTSTEGAVDNATFYKVDTTGGALTELATYTELPCYMAYHPILDAIFTADCHNLPEEDHIPRSVGVMDLTDDPISVTRIGYYAEPVVESPRVRGLVVAPTQICP